jgi:hypothetical protein
VQLVPGHPDGYLGKVAVVAHRRTVGDKLLIDAGE